MSATATHPTTSTPAAYELKITRTFDAPRELVWKAWTDPAMLRQWMGPRGFDTSEITMPAEENARWSRKMHGLRPANQQMAYLGQGGTVLEVRPPELLKFTFAWDDRSGVGLGPSPYQENTVTIRLEEKGSQTVMHFTQGPFASEGECNGHTGGWNSSFDKFADFLAANQPDRVQDLNHVPTELHLKHVFKAPRDVVFAAWTDPKQLAKWWGPHGFTAPRCEFEPKGGGDIRIDMRAPDGTIYPMAGRVLEFYPPYRFHFTASALDAQGKPLFENWNSIFFEEVEGGTRVTLDVHVKSQTDLAPQYLRGMPAGWTQSLEKLAGYLERSDDSQNQHRRNLMKTNLHLGFTGTCDAAFAFYETVFRTRRLMTMKYGDAPAGVPCPEGSRDLVMHTAMPLGSITLMGADAPPGRGKPFGGFEVFLEDTDEAEVRRLFAALSEGGSVTMPLAPTFWTPLFGMCTDKFGVNWMVSIPGPEA